MVKTEKSLRRIPPLFRVNWKGLYEWALTKFPPDQADAVCALLGHVEGMPIDPQIKDRWMRIGIIQERTNILKLPPGNNIVEKLQVAAKLYVELEKSDSEGDKNEK